MRRLIVLLVSLVVSLLVTVAEASVNQCEVIKGPQIEVPYTDIGFGQMAIEYDAYLCPLQSVEHTAIKRPVYDLNGVKAEQKTEVCQRYLKKSGTARICGLETIQ